MINNDALETVRRHLSAEEHIEWVGGPDPANHFTRADLFLVPFSLFWGGGVIFWLVGATTAGGAFGLFGVPFVLVGLYFIFGRFAYKAYRKRRTVYAVTDRRVLEIVRRQRGESVDAVYLRSLPSISTSVGADGKGSVRFGPTTPWFGAMYANTGMEFLSRGAATGGVAFYDIDDPRGVAELIERLREADRSG
jgi:hypothetical protein